MNAEGSSDGQPQLDELDELVQRARTGLRAWTDQPDSDPGVALLDLFAFVADLLTSHADQVAAEAYLGDEGRARLALGDGVHGRRPPTDQTIGARYRQGGGYVSVHQQQGRVSLDDDVVEDPLHLAIGVHRAVVLNTSDPLRQGRLQVRIPALDPSGSVWAVACLPVSGTSASPADPGDLPLPAVGDGVWVAFEVGDPSRPVWLGRVGG